jgi:hypothetical protein
MPIVRYLSIQIIIMQCAKNEKKGGEVSIEGFFFWVVGVCP